MRNKLLLMLLSIVCVLCCVFGFAACDNTPSDTSSIKLNKYDLTLDIGETETIVATVVTNDVGLSTKWSSLDQSVATVNDNGTVTAIAGGTTWIRAECGNGLSAECKVTVREPIKIRSITLNKTVITLVIGSEETLAVTVEPDNAQETIKWRSDNDKIASVDSNGKVSAKSQGSTTIFAYVDNGESASCLVNVSEPIAVEEIVLSKNSIELSVGDEETLDAAVIPNDATDKTINWSVSPAEIVSVANGKVTAVAEGSAIITATVGGKSAQCSVTVGNFTKGLAYTFEEGKGYYVSVGTATDAKIVIPSTHNGEPVVGILYRAFAECEFITSVTIPNSVKTIDFNAFQMCSGLTSITLPDSVTIIAGNVFRECSNLESVTLGGGAVSLDRNVFDGCDKLTSLTVNGALNLSYDAFNGCPSLNRINVNNLAKWCASENLYYLMSLTPDIYIDGRIIQGEFAIPDGITSVCDYAFFGCIGITSVVIPNSVTSIGGSVFSNCNNLHSVTIGIGLTEISYDAFGKCNRLANIYYTGGLAEWCAIDGLSALTSAGAEYYTDWPALFVDGQELAGELVIPDGVTAIPNGAFSKRQNITSVVIPYSVTTIGNNAFSYCFGLTSLSLPDGVKTIDSSAFYNCDSLEKVVISDSVTNINSSAFQDCHKLSDVTFGNGIIAIESYAFYNCNLKQVTLPSSVRTLGDNVFYNCRSLTALMLNEGLQAIGDICYLPSLTSLVIPSTVTEIGNIFSCENLSEITFPQGLDTSRITFNDCPKYKGTLVGNIYVIGSKLVNVAEGAVSVIVPESITTIGANAFKSAISTLKYVYVPLSVKTAEANAFDGCGNVIRFYEGSEMPGSTFNDRVYRNIGLCTADGWLYDDSGSEASIRAYIGAGGEVTVPAQIAGKQVTEISQQGGVGNVFLERDDITKIIFTSSTLSVDAGTLSNLVNLTEIALSEQVYSLTMSKAAFEGSSQLSKISLAGEYVDYQLVIISFTSSGGVISTETFDITDAADVFQKIYDVSDTSVCMITVKDAV